VTSLKGDTARVGRFGFKLATLNLGVALNHPRRNEQWQKKRKLVITPVVHVSPETTAIIAARSVKPPPVQQNYRAIAATPAAPAN
jgi:hypothetical protein